MARRTEKKTSCTICRTRTTCARFVFDGLIKWLCARCERGVFEHLTERAR